MPESRIHMELVRRTHQYISRRFPLDAGFVIYLDSPETSRSNKPPRIGGFVPDVLAADVPTTFNVIGEAKTPGDLETDHTLAQFTAYCRYLKVRTGVLVVTVPWTVSATARRIVACSVAATGADNVETVFLDDVQPCP